MLEENVLWPRYELLTGRSFPIDIRESEDKKQYIIESSLPGVKPEEIQITAEDNLITIRAVRKAEEKKEKENYVRHERYEGEMSRTIALPARIDADKVQATFENGVLTLQIPKAEGTKTKQIPVKAKETAGAH
jgi:HSP20 family protein